MGRRSSALSRRNGTRWRATRWAETLVEEVCTPCHGGVSPPTREETERYLDAARRWLV
jgi:hypothetical protein